MPEGDSLYRAAQKLRPVLVGQCVEALSLPRRTDATEGLLQRGIEAVEARGKNLLVHFDGGLSLHVHLKMHGRIRVLPRVEETAALRRRDVVALLCTGEHAVVVQRAPVARLLRRADLVRDFHFRHLGPDLLGDDFDDREALRRLRLRQAQPLGVALMDQGAVAGIGNVWKSELCFNRRLDPFAPVHTHTDDELLGLLAHARERMAHDVSAPRRTRPDPFTPPPFQRRVRVSPRQGEGPLSVYERAGQACYDCGGRVRMAYQGDPPRSTYHCPDCQPLRDGR